MQLPNVCNSFGFHASNTRHYEKDLWNISVVAGWIPIFGSVLAGGHHVFQGLAGNDNALVARGVCEIIGLGPLLMPVDLVVTAVRFYNQEQSAVKHWKV